jgi:hypothetical protein
MENIKVERSSEVIHEMHASCRLAGASMLVCSVDPMWGNIYFWMGKERRNMRWPEGSETWSDFGGRPQGSETSTDIAAREFVEESCGMLRYFEHDTTPRYGWEDISHDLQCRRYIFRITMWTTDDMGVKKIFVTYVKQIPWQPDAMDRYSECMSTLVNIKMCLKHGSPVSIPPNFHSPALSCHTNVDDRDDRVYVLNRDFMEKEVIQLWSMPQLRTAIDECMAHQESPFNQQRAMVACRHHFHNNIGMKRINRFRRCFITLMCCVFKEIVYFEPRVIEKPTSGHTNGV